MPLRSGDDQRRWARTRGAPGRRMLPAALVALALFVALAPAASARRAPRPTAHASVIGGSRAAQGQFPWLAFVANVQQNVACSGTIVSPMLVLTAGHCVFDLTNGTLASAADLRVVTGTVDWSSNTGQLLNVSKITLDPVFNPATLDGDAALLTLSAPTQSPQIALATSQDAELMSAGTSAQMAGWGYTAPGGPNPPTTLYWGPTVVQSASYCSQQEALDGIVFDPLTALCAVDAPSFAAATCHGDSGGPLIATSASGDQI